MPTRTDRVAPDSIDEVSWHRPRLAVPLVAAVTVVLVVVFTGLPDATRSLPWLARHAMRIALPRWGTTEAVNEVVYGSRGWDTFGETFILLAAVVAVALLCRTREPRAEYLGEATAGQAEQHRADPREGADAEESEARDAEKAETEDDPAPDDADRDPLGAPAPERAAAMTVIVRVAARIAAPVLAVASVYLAAWGYTPGGGFPAGAALTGVAILIYTAFGHRTLRGVARTSVLEPIEMAGALAIVAIGALGLAFKHAFFENWLPLAPQQTIRAGGTLQAFSGMEIVEVATGLSIAVFSLLGMEHDWAPDKGNDDDQEASS
jgi:multicomponent Na+:H+ antiporter subunit B